MKWSKDCSSKLGTAKDVVHYQRNLVINITLLYFFDTLSSVLVLFKE